MTFMNSKIINTLIFTSITLVTSAQAANGLYGQPGTAPTNQATDYDVVQDNILQSVAGLSNNAINNTQTNAQGINTVAQQAGTNAANIGKTNSLVAQNTQGVQQLTQQVGQNAAAIGKVNGSVGALNQQVGANTTAIQQQLATSGNYVTKPEMQTAVDQKVDTVTYSQRIADVDNRIKANKDAQQKTNQTVAAHSRELTNHEDRITALEQTNPTNFSKLKHTVESNRRRASAGIAGVSAMANIPQVIQGQTFAVGAGVGTTDNESAVAVGFSARATEHVIVKASVSDDTQQNFVLGGGVSYGW